jgi:hypothetical protein
MLCRDEINGKVDTARKYVREMNAAIHILRAHPAPFKYKHSPLSGLREHYQEFADETLHLATPGGANYSWKSEVTNTAVQCYAMHYWVRELDKACLRLCIHPPFCVYVRAESVGGPARSQRCHRAGAPSSHGLMCRPPRWWQVRRQTPRAICAQNSLCPSPCPPPLARR